MNDLSTLPRPNSGKFTFEEANLRKNEIYDNAHTEPVAGWIAPKFGIGFCIHITSEDQIKVGNFNRDSPSKATDYNAVNISELKEMISLASAFSEPGKIAITSEKDFRDAKVFPKIFDYIYKPSIQILYISKQNKAKPQR